ncbi:helix-turn-helix domain-containing protein [Microbulbifer sp. 2304DJ12-6]|uniref:AraC family transcriptional regulator n=1 Tax=Microbulbifer sp. 2304DJ12-6 TaxID=3233340 RepID=UPI0039AEC5BC
MNLSNQLLFFFSALGAFNGLLLTSYLAFSKPSNIQKSLLAALMLTISLRISKSVWFYFDPTLGKQFLQLGLSACFLIGPLLYFYIASSVDRLGALRIKWTWHLGLLFALLIGTGVLYPYQSNVELWGLFYRIINFEWLVYILMSAHLLSPTVKQWMDGKIALKWRYALNLNVFAGITIVWLAYFTASYTSYIVGALSFSLILYLSVLVWLLYKREAPEKKSAYADKKIDKDTELHLADRLHELMATQELYKNPNLSLPVLARKVQMSTPQLSQLLNDNLQKSFALYVNEWRIKEAKRLLLESPKATMESIAEAAGYNSQSTFYSVFKQFEVTTPAKYRKRHLQCEA